MNKKEFMERLEKLLLDISESERAEALQFYSDYFDDAGVENEAQVMEELGSPEQAAKKIKAGLSEGSAEYTEAGYRDTRFRENQEVAEHQAVQTEKPKKNVNGWKVLAVILLCILLFPVIVPICGTIVGLMIAAVVGAFALIVALAAAGIAVLLAGISLIIIGFVQMFAVFPVGIALAGAGCIVFALGIPVFLLGIWCCIKGIPWLIRGVVAVCRFPFRKAGMVQ